MNDCLNCGNYLVFYTKVRDRFQKERQGFCDLDRKVVKNHDSCEKWRNNLWRRKVSKKLCLKTLDTALKNISEIKQILSEELDENAVNPLSN